MRSEPSAEATGAVTVSSADRTPARALSQPTPVYPSLGAPPADRVVVRVLGAPEVSYGDQVMAINRPTVLEHLCYLALHAPHDLRVPPCVYTSSPMPPSRIGCVRRPSTPTIS